MKRLELLSFAGALAVTIFVALGQMPAHGSPSAAEQYDIAIADAKATMLIDPAKALSKAQNAENMADRLAEDQRLLGIATAEWLRGEAYLRLNAPLRAAPMLNQAISIVKKLNVRSKLSGDLLLSQGGLYTSTANVAGALASYQGAYIIFRNLGETRSCAKALVSIALLYQDAGSYQEAIKYNNQALEIYNVDAQLMFAIYGNKGIEYNQLGKFNLGQKELEKALKISELLKSPMLRARTLVNIARGQLQAKKFEEADRTINLGLKVARTGDAELERKQFAILMASSALHHHQLPEAVRLITRSFAGVALTKTTLDMHDGHEAAYDIFKAVGNEREALRHLEALKRLDDQTAKLSASANTALAAARFDFANQETRIQKLRADELQRNIDDATLAAKNQQIIFAVAGVTAVAILALLAFGLVTIRRSRNDVRAANVDLAQTNDALGKALAAKTEFLATTSHEIRTPLNGILGMTQVMLADRSLSAPLRDRIEVVHGAGITMRALVDDILDVAKMETGNLTIEHVPFDLTATLRDVARLWEEQARAKGIGFTLELEDCPVFIEGDAARLRQIAFNLLSNALKFTASGTVTLRADTATSATGTLLAISVRDSGIGIPADKLGIIFESFRQVDAGTTRRFGGTGLGLAICQNLAQAMGGIVRVESEAGSGSTFTLELPLVRAAPPTVLTVVEAGSDALLIVDRNPISRSMLRAVLEARAGSVVFASSVDEAIARVATGGIAQILVDDMTIRASEDVTASLAALGKAGIPVALLWATPREDDVARCETAGIVLIAKPIAGAALAARLFDPLPVDIGRGVTICCPMFLPRARHNPIDRQTMIAFCDHPDGVSARRQ